jgi:hypothetical protein
MPSDLLSRERDNLIDLGWLLAALGVMASIAMEHPSFLQVMVLLVIACLTSRHRAPDPSASFWQKALARLPWQGLVIGTGAVIFLWWGRLPILWLTPLAAWPVFPFCCRFDWAAFTHWLSTRFEYRSLLEWVAARVREAEALLVCLTVHLGSAFWSFWPARPAALGLSFLWVGLRMIGRRLPSPTIPAAGLVVPGLGMGLILLTGMVVTPGGISRGHWVLGAGLAAAMAQLHRRKHLHPEQPKDAGNEAVRVTVVACLAVWVLRGFATPTMHGTPDALWYGTMLHDMVLQTRAGIFPVFVGQSEYQFNGAIYPLRVAPAFHYLGALLDCLTLRSLGTFALQNLLITLIGLSATVAVYYCLASLLQVQRSLAGLFAVLFISCPGIVGMAYNTDLFMSWTTLPWVVIAFWATVRSFHQPDAVTFAALGGSVGLVWWGHSPIALWSSIVLGSMQVLRVITNFRTNPAWRSMFLAAGIFVLIAAYPIGSVLLYPPESGINAAGFQRAAPGTIAHFVAEAFPGTLLPLSAKGRSLSDFQLGYALLAIWLGCVIWGWRASSAAARGLMVWTGAFLLLLLPWPVLNFWAWKLVPAFVRDTTGNWAMNRLYLLCATCVLTGAATVLSRLSLWSAKTRVFKQWALVLILCSTGWSLLETRKFVVGSTLGFRSLAHTEAMLAPENIMITRFAYLVFPRLPPHFSHGVMDPQLLHRILASDLHTVLTDNQQAARAAARPVSSVRLLGQSTGEAVYEPSEPVVLSPDRHYLADFAFALPPSESVVLQVFGRRLHREYALPEYGEARSFGQGGQHVSTLSLFTSAAQPESVRLRLVPSSGISPPNGAVGATVQLLEYDRQQLPVQVSSWAPYRSTANSTVSGWLETPRMYQDGYAATVNGTPAEIRKSPDGLVAIALPAGATHVTLSWQAPTGLLALFWTSLLGSVCWLCLAAWQSVYVAKLSPTPTCS